ncbi:hypothetical protein ACFX1S_043236 [Malus domestica]
MLEKRIPITLTTLLGSQYRYGIPKHLRRFGSNVVPNFCSSLSNRRSSFPSEKALVEPSLVMQSRGAQSQTRAPLSTQDD